MEAQVRAYALAVAQDVTQRGPIAWRQHSADTPAFFMAVNGRMVFPNGQAAQAGIEGVSHTLRRVELTWGDDLRIDPLAADLALVASSYHEVQLWVDSPDAAASAGRRVEDSGFFTGTAEYLDGHWIFRNMHWSSIAPPSPPVR